MPRSWSTPMPKAANRSSSAIPITIGASRCLPIISCATSIPPKTTASSPPSPNSPSLASAASGQRRASPPQRLDSIRRFRQRLTQQPAPLPGDQQILFDPDAAEIAQRVQPAVIEEIEKLLLRPELIHELGYEV